MKTLLERDRRPNSQELLAALNAAEIFSKGQVLEVIVLSINVEDRRMSLGTRPLEPKE